GRPWGPAFVDARKVGPTDRRKEEAPRRRACPEMTPVLRRGARPAPGGGGRAAAVSPPVVRSIPAPRRRRLPRRAHPIPVVRLRAQAPGDRWDRSPRRTRPPRARPPRVGVLRSHPARATPGSPTALRRVGELEWGAGPMTGMPPHRGHGPRDQAPPTSGGGEASAGKRRRGEAARC